MVYGYSSKLMLLILNIKWIRKIYANLIFVSDNKFYSQYNLYCNLIAIIYSIFFKVFKISVYIIRNIFFYTFVKNRIKIIAYVMQCVN